MRPRAPVVTTPLERFCTCARFVSVDALHKQRRKHVAAAPAMPMTRAVMIYYLTCSQRAASFYHPFGRVRSRVDWGRLGDLLSTHPAVAAPSKLNFFSSACLQASESDCISLV